MSMAAEHSTATGAAQQLTMKRAGLWLFFFSECILFGLVMSSRFFLEGIEAAHLDQALGLGITVILLLSSVTAFSSETAMKHNRRRASAWWLAATIALGFVFAAGVAYEWSVAEFSRHEAFGSVFFTMTGLHATHVLTGLVMLGLVLAQMLRGHYAGNDMWPVQGTVMYWHFVDVVWVFYYPALYLVQGV